MIDIRSSFDRLLFQDCSTNGNKTYDEERVSWGAEYSLERRRRSMRIQRPGKSTILLFLLDVLVIWLLIHQLEPLITLLRRNEELFKPQVTLSDQEDLNSLHKMHRSSRIPRILHQTASTNIVPDKWVESQASCKEAYGDFEYKSTIPQKS
ncbi:mannosyl phosphorylinositol ceramide synthase sur1 protein [Penicillium sp. IBT 18751x]|nr:mannosyl phosphorylinositol ceramide synthase sur1 protein [Penicillium sp. IBT 18751x]